MTTARPLARAVAGGYLSAKLVVRDNPSVFLAGILQYKQIVVGTRRNFGDARFAVVQISLQLSAHRYVVKHTIRALGASLIHAATGGTKAGSAARRYKWHG